MSFVRLASVTYHEVDTGATTKDIGARNNSSATSQPFRWPGVVKGGSLAIKLHIARVDTRPEHPRIIEVASTSLDQQDLQLVIEIGQAASNNTAVLRVSARR